MSLRFSSLLLASVFILSACSTSSVTDEERELPTDEAAQTLQDGTYTADVSESLIAFTGTRAPAVSHEGKFTDFTFSMKVEDGLPKAINLSIPLESMVTDSDGLTKHLLNEDFFDAAQYPTVDFVATALIASGEDQYSVVGTLSMHGVSSEVAFDATITSGYLTLSTSIDRTVYGIGAVGTPKSVDHDVPIEAKIVFE